MKTDTYIKTFSTSTQADTWMRRKNQVARDGSIFCLVNGPEDNYAVVDLTTAIDLGGAYTWGR